MLHELAFGPDTSQPTLGTGHMMANIGKSRVMLTNIVSSYGGKPKAVEVGKAEGGRSQRQGG